MFLLMMISLMMLIISNLIMKISILLTKKLKINFEKMSPFECGFNPIFFKRMPFSMRFFMITIIFLIFDIEIALLLPLVMSMKTSNLLIWMSSSMIFNVILIIGLFHEWNHGALNWL